MQITWFPFVFLLCYLSLFTTALGQNSKIDSLKSVLTNLDSQNKEDASKTLRSIGVGYFEIGEFNEALNYYEKALAIGQEIDNPRIISRCIMNIGNVYLATGNYPLALDYNKRSLEINERTKDTTLMSLSLNNLGLIHRNLENYEKAVDFTERALSIQIKNDNKKRMAETMNGLGLLYIEIEDYTKAIQTLSEALKICKETNNVYIEGFTLNNIGYVYLNSGDYHRSIAYYEKAKRTNLSIDGKRSLTASYYGLAKANAQLKNYLKALPSALKSRELAQSINMAGFEKDIHELLSVIYQNTGRYQEALGSYKQFKQLNDSIFNKKNTEKIAQLEAEYKFERALDSANIRELQLTQEVMETSKHLELSQRNYLWAIIGVLLVSILSGFIIFYQKLKNAKAKTQNAIIEQKLLRSQMTPHFIFNSLSVLQGMILNQEDKKSVSYLSKFSKLLRITLENSRDKMVFLSDELKAVENYLALQNLENDAYLYKVSVDDSVNVTALVVPPMLIQPFAENAIEHAFVNSHEDRRIEIRLNYSNNRLVCTIIDNGIGYEQQRVIRNDKKRSLSTKITSERLEILSKDLKMEGSVTIQDRKHLGAQGTIVTLVIPFKTVKSS